MEMQMEYIRKLPEPQELMEQFPIDDKVKAVKAKRDEEIKHSPQPPHSRCTLG